MRHPTVTAVCAALLAGTPALAGDHENDRVLTERDLKPLAWRSIGPANMGGRVAALAICPGDPKTFYIGYATGGLWKTTNNGTTFAPVFDEIEDTSSIGAVCLADAPEDWSGWKAIDEAAGETVDRVTGMGRIVWVGTGEGNGRNSSSWGHGVYRSVDGGASFEHRGLADTHDIPAMAVDPRDPDVCYVAALGHLWGANEERGVYKTTDGGATWKAVLRIDENTGACDVILDPADPDRVYAAMYMRRRAGWSYQSGGPEGGIYGSDDGGRNWTKLTEGLPARTGRIGLDVCTSQPGIVMAIVESDVGGTIKEAFNNRSRAGGVYRSEDHGATWERLSDFAPRSFYFSRIRIDPVDPDRVYLLGWDMYVSDDGGRTFRAGATKALHVDFHAMVIDPTDTDHLIVGNDGGCYVSWDKGKTWDFHNHMAVGQFYNIAVDDSDPYRVGGGLQDNGSWVGVGETVHQNDGEWMGGAVGVSNAEWRSIWGGDGFHVAFDPEDRNIVYAEWQGGNLARIHLDTGTWRELKPAAKEGEPNYRFNWNAPFLISPHDHTVLYFGGNHVFKMTERGDAWSRISPDLSRNEIDQIRSAGSQAETWGTVVSLAESPVTAGVLWAGSDDGRMHVTGNDGGAWRDVTPEALKGRYVSKIEASPHDAGTAYVAVDGHRSDSFEALVLVTEDLGATWNDISGDLPEGRPVKVVRADPHNTNVLYAGTERAAYVTIDRGARWVRLNGKSLPTVAVDDLQVQVRENDLVAGTHGRSIWVLDDASPLSQLAPDIVASKFHVFDPVSARPRSYLGYDGVWSDKMFAAPNPKMGGYIHYWIRDYADEDVKITIEDAAGNPVRELTGTNRPGLNRVIWNLQRAEREQIGNPHELTEFVPAGAYKVTVKHGEDTGSAWMDVLEGPE